MTRTRTSPLFLRLALVTALVLALGTAVLRSQEPVPGADRKHPAGRPASVAAAERWWTWVVDR